MATTDNSVLFGRFYPEYDIVVSLLWVFIILGGVGNWVVMWCILKTKSLRNPFNMLVLALAFANGVATTVVGPMNLHRILMAHAEVTVDWCNARVLLKTFCFSVCIMIIFTLSVMRLCAGLRTTLIKLTFKEISAIIVCIYGLAALTSPVLLEKTEPTYQSCLGVVDDDSLRKILQNEGLLPRESIHASTANQLDNDIGYTQSTTHAEDLHQYASTQAMTDSISTTADSSNMTFSNDTIAFVSGGKTKFWMYYLLVSVTLFIGTLGCYVSLVIIIRIRKNSMSGINTSNTRDILTMRVTAYVTCLFCISFLIPFFPALTNLHPEETAAYMHYVSICHCLSYIDGALTPIIYYFSNPAFRIALLKALPHCIRRCIIHNNQIASMPATQPSPPQPLTQPKPPSVPSISLLVPPQWTQNSVQH